MYPFFRQKTVLIVTISIMLGLVCLPSVQAQNNPSDGTVYVVGSSTIHGSDMSIVRQAAIDNGLTVAVSRVLTDVVPAETLAGSFQLINDTILERADQFVQDYKVITESTVHQTYRLLVQATVSIARLKSSLKAAGVFWGQITYPRVLLCIAEKRTQDEPFTYWWNGQSPSVKTIASQTLANILGSDGFVLVPPSRNAILTEASAELTTAQAVSLGNLLNADVVIAGTAYAEPAANTTGNSVSYRGFVQVTAYRVADGAPLAQVQQSSLAAGHDAFSGTEEALRSASKLASQQLSAQVKRQWFKDSQGGRKIEVVIQGIGGKIANFVQLRGTLSTTSGVNDVQLQEMTPSQAVVRIDYQGTVQALADQLQQLTFDTFSINIGEISGNTINMQLVPR